MPSIFTADGAEGSLPPRSTECETRPVCPELGVNEAAFGMYGIGDLLPGGNLFRRVEARRERAADGVRRDVDGFRDDQAGRGALRIVFDCQRADHAAGVGAAAGHGGHDHVVLQRVGAEGGGFEQFHACVLLCGRRPCAGFRADLRRRGLKEVAVWTDHSGGVPGGLPRIPAYAAVCCTPSCTVQWEAV